MSDKKLKTVIEVVDKYSKELKDFSKKINETNDELKKLQDNFSEGSEGAKKLSDSLGMIKKVGVAAAVFYVGNKIKERSLIMMIDNVKYKKIKITFIGFIVQ